MHVLDRQTVAAAPGRGGSNPVHLRLRADGQLLELPLGKTTIGSSPRCNLRIQQPGVQPLHCLIVHGPEGLSVRRWAADTQLNGATFDDASLAAGDRLVLGGVELELVKSQSAAAKAEAPKSAPVPADRCHQLLDAVQESVETITRLEAEPCEPTDEYAAHERVSAQVESLKEAATTAAEAAQIVFRELQAACAMSRGRSRKMLAALRAQRRQNEELQQRLADAGEQLAELNQQRTTWEDSHDYHEADQRDWQLPVQELRQQFSTWENRLAEQAQRVSELQQELVAARSNGAPVAAPANTMVSMPALEVAAHDIEPVEPTGSHRPIADSWANASSAPVIASKIDKPKVSRESQSDERAAFAVVESKLAVETPALLPDITVPVAEAPATPKFQPASFIESYSHLLAEDAASEPAPAAAPQRPLAAESAASKPRTMGVVRNESGTTAGVASEDEESIDQYMAKLLQRVRGDTPHAAASQAPPAAEAVKEVAPAMVSSPPDVAHSAPMEHSHPAAEEPETEEEAAQAMVDWEAIARRAVAAKPMADMGALRALANDSARGAINRHELKKHRRDAVTKMIVSTLAGMTSLWLMLESPHRHDIRFITACVLMIVAAYWAGETLWAMLKLLRAAAYDGSESLHDEFQPGLPIDVEKRL